MTRKYMGKAIWKAYENGQWDKKEMLAELQRLYGVIHWSIYLAEKRGCREDLAGVIVT